MKQTVQTFHGFKAVLLAFILASAPIFSTLKAANAPCGDAAPVVATATIYYLSPASATAGSSGFVLQIVGTGFNDPIVGGDVNYNGSFRVSTYISSGELRISLTAADLLVPGTFPIYVMTAAGTSNTVNFYVVPCTIYTAVASAAWTTPSTWACGSVPIATSDVAIPSGRSVTLSGSATTVNDLTLSGTGKLTLNVPITVNGILTGSSTAYIVSHGVAVTQNVTAGVAAVFPIGANSGTYDPFTITSNLTQKVSASVARVLNAPPIAGYLAQEQAISNFWNITPASSATVATLSFRPDPTTLTSDAAGWMSYGYSTSPSATVGTIGHFISSSRAYYFDQYKATISSGTWTVSNYSGGYSPFQLGYGGAFNPTTLAVGLKSFSAKSKNGANLIEWTTEQERDNALFTIERSTDGARFDAIGTVKGKGSTTQNHDYFFEDKDPSVFSTYYRLKMTESGGNTTLSNVLTVVGNKDKRLNIFPTLTHDRLTIVGNAQTAERFDIVNVLGQTVESGICEGQKEVNVSGLINGIYVVRMTGQSIKFIKN